ncbi:SDR family NAD(P)-dependent oxidoreductase [Lutibacter sp.]|uniref:SDR family NAD(P)-dependent oxidoreductase n=1 Tax=Lutibacter sp. TaxID=1925666 RepID=UPI0027341198|nr:SDR family NAD(P)-dependent oxidoreductase [Lutibacter sp.]MDP3312888.1 SDR family NAD(P)-dependent oxidoreductase [Lutibacter sp.]
MKNVLIIGATSGIGKELAKLYVQNNCTVIITGRRLQMLEEIKAENPSKFIIKQHDVTDNNATLQLFETLKRELNTIDLIIYSAGIGDPNYELTWEKELPTLQTNVIAATFIYGLAYKLFRVQGFGHLVGISSIASIRGNRHVPAYFASKSFQASYLESLWMKGKRSKAKIYVTDIQPGFVDTAMALGKTFWMASLDKATKQIYKAIEKKKKKAYITKRWAIIAFVLRRLPSNLLYKFS